MYVDNAGNEFDSYRAACRYYGADTPEDCAAEEEFWARVEGEALMDQMYAGVIQPGAVYPVRFDDEIPW